MSSSRNWLESDGQEFFKAAAHFGMRADAADGWSQMHVQPHHVCSVAMTAGVLGSTAFPFLHIFGSSWPTVKIHIPALTVFVCLNVHVGGVWRYGPKFCGKRASQVLISGVTICGVYLYLASCVGPLSFVPFQNRLASTIGHAVGILFMNVFSSCGGMAAEQPAQPHVSLLTPVTNAAFSTLRLVDSGTDMGLVRVLWDQVSPHCHFRRPQQSLKTSAVHTS